MSMFDSVYVTVDLYIEVAYNKYGYNEEQVSWFVTLKVLQILQLLLSLMWLWRGIP